MIGSSRPAAVSAATRAPNDPKSGWRPHRRRPLPLRLFSNLKGDNDNPSRLGRAARFLALLAVAVQLLTPVVALHQSPSQAGQGIFAALVEAGLICHAAGNDQQPTPGQPAGPLPRHIDHAACCPWHGNADPTIPRLMTVEPVGFRRTGVAFAAYRTLHITARPEGGTRARAPPIPA
ncbi:MAG: DUF2946 family protein [Alphaproteobacteria bacterium]